ncbi:MAG TPA: RHS repeat domain-containing protein, partial [Labilithrix sp.]|nr:RHS repeat domain-containing protein [Labilithrix sp.]
MYRADGRLGRVTNADGIHDFTYDARGLLATQTIAGEGVYAYGDAFLRRVWKTQGASAEYYAYEGLDRIAIIGPNGVDPNTGFSVPGPVLESYLFAGIDPPSASSEAPAPPSTSSSIS